MRNIRTPIGGDLIFTYCCSQISWMQKNEIVNYQFVALWCLFFGISHVFRCIWEWMRDFNCKISTQFSYNFTISWQCFSVSLPFLFSLLVFFSSFALLPPCSVNQLNVRNGGGALIFVFQRLLMPSIIPNDTETIHYYFYAISSVG